MTSGHIKKFVALGCVALFLAACDSAEERAEKHFESGLSLLEEGDVERAIVEFRNVLALNEFHREARAEYAKAVLELGNVSEAYAHFLRLSEADPTDMSSRVELAKMAIASQNWAEAERHSGALRDANANLDGAEAVDAVMRYRQSVLDEDEPAQREVFQEIVKLSEKYPNDTNLLRVLIEYYARNGETAKSLETIDRAIAVAPDQEAYYRMKAAALAEQEDFNALEEHFRVMLARFPNAEGVAASLVRLLVVSGQAERAEEFMREEIANSDTPIEVHVGLVAFIRELNGDDAALAEIASALEIYEDDSVMRALRAGILFDQGNRDNAIAEMEAAIDGKEPSARIDQLKVGLAKMLVADGNQVGARTLIGEVLENDATQVEALKMQGRWQIQSDDTDTAIASLRSALDQEPEDTETMSLLADAHQRAGEFEIAQDLLALAAETSGFAPNESIRFARLLLDQERLRPAEDVLVSALRRSPGNINLLRLLADVYLENEDWTRLQDVENALRRDGSENAIAVANTLRLQALARTQGQNQALSFLEELAEDESLGNAPRITLLSTKIRTGDAEGAVALARELAEENAGNPRAQMLVANTFLGLSQYEDAESTLRQIVTDTPAFEPAWVQLIRSQSAQGERDRARETLDEALAAQPESMNLLWAKASFLEQANDIDGAIGIYEELYARNSNSPIIANNYASLLATYRNDEESLERAYTIGRRLRGTEIAPFQDTYGWILFRRGDFEEAITYLEPAAEAIASDPIVQFHLAEAYRAAGREIKALEQYELVVELAGPDDPREQIAKAIAAIEELGGSTTSE